MDLETDCLCVNLELLLKKKLEELPDKPKREVKDLDKLPYSVTKLYNECNKKGIGKS
jgi:hypothetical protein